MALERAPEADRPADYGDLTFWFPSRPDELSASCYVNSAKAFLHIQCNSRME
jgi:hypothetical protein